MTLRVDWTTVDQPPIVLTLTPIPGGYMVSDQHGRPWTLAPVDLPFALTFMRAAAVKNHALIDEASVERATWQSSERGPTAGTTLLASPVPASVAAHETPPLSDEYSRKVPTNVVPIR